MNRIEKKIYLKIFLLAMILFGLFYVSFIYLPTEITLRSSDIIQKREESIRLEMQNEQIEDIKEKYQNLENNLDEIFDNILPFSEISNFVIEMRENVTKETGVELQISSGSIGDIDDELSYINYNINVKGDFNQIMHFFDYMESLKYKNAIEEIAISSGGSGSSINLRAVLKVYIWK